MIAIGIPTPITGLTPIPLTVTDDGYTLTIADSQPIIPPNSGGLGVEVEGIAVAQEPGQTISVEGEEIAIGGSTGYTVTLTCLAPIGDATFQSLEVGDLPTGVSATVNLNTAPGTSTITFNVASNATPGTYTYTITAIIDDWYGSFGPTPPDGIQNVTLTPSQNTPPTSSGAFTLNVADFVGKIPVTQTPYFTLYALPVDYSPTISLGTHTTSADVSVDIAYTIAVGAPIVVHLPLNPAIPPGLYTATIMGYAGDDSATVSVDLLVTGPVLQSAPIALYPTLTIGPAWPPPQVLTTDGTVTLTTDDYAYSINQGDTIDIGIYAEGFTAFTGYWNFFLSEQSPERIVGTTPRFQNLWCVFPSNNKPESYSPTPGTPTLITTANLVTTLTTPPGVYAFTIAENVPTLNPNYMTLTQTGTPTNTGKFRIYLGSDPVIEGNPPYIFCSVYIASIGGWFDWVTLETTAPPGVTVAPPNGSQSKGGWGMQITPDADLAPGTYPINITGTNGSDYATLQLTLTIIDISSPYNGIPGATINVQVMDVGGEQATAPSTLLSGTMKNPLSVSRRAQTGLVATSHQGRQVFRALAIPTNRRTPPQTYARARHVSITIAQALQTDEILEVWSVAAGVFPGHDQIPETIISSVGGSTFYNPMTPAQLQYLCQSTQLAFNNPVTTLPAPVAPPYALAPGEQIAWYPQAESMRANAVYNAAYVCIGFTLAYTYLPTDTYFGGYASSSQAPNGWIISATSASASSVSSKSGSGFAVLGYYVGWPTPAQILADWIAVYGNLPDKGTIYFSVRPADPFVGVTGMEMTSRCSYENGTLAGAIIPPDPSIYFDISTIWVGPKVTSNLPANQPTAVGYEQAGAAIIPPGGANDVQLFFQGVSAFGGNGWTAGAPYAGMVTCEGKIASVNAANRTSGLLNTKQPIPPITVTFNPPTVTIPNGDTTPIATTATFHLPAGTPSGTWLFHLKGTDGKQTLTQKILVECNAGAPSASGLALTPMASAVPIVSGTDRTINFTLSNPNSAPQTLEIFFPANLIYYGFSGPIGSIDFSISPGTNPVTVPAGTPGTPGTVNFTLTIHPTGTITTGRNFILLITATNSYITLAALLDLTT